MLHPSTSEEASVCARRVAEAQVKAEGTIPQGGKKGSVEPQGGPSQLARVQSGAGTFEDSLVFFLKTKHILIKGPGNDIP